VSLPPPHHALCGHSSLRSSETVRTVGALGGVVVHCHSPPPPPTTTTAGLAIIFRGKNLAYFKNEMKDYDKRVDVYFQPKAWADRPTCTAHLNKTLARMYKKGMTVVGNTGVKLRWLTVVDSLDGQATEQYREAHDRLGSTLWFGPPKMTDDWQVCHPARCCVPHSA
jgi:hypothetical protein